MTILVQGRGRLITRRRKPRPASTPRTREVAALFGLALGESPDGADPVPRVTPIPIRAGQIILIAGPSGAGKTTLLRGIDGALRERRVPRDWPTPETRRRGAPSVPAAALDREAAVIDAVGGADLPQALAALARAGLSDAHVLLRQIGLLSEGERFRFALARWYASTAPVLLCDEFCAALDSVTARIVSHQLRRFVTTHPRTAIVATCREDLLSDLRPDLILRPDMNPLNL